MKYQKIEISRLRNLMELVWLASAFAAVLFTAGCLGTDDTNPNNLDVARYTLQPFEDCSELDGYLVDAAVEQFVDSYYGYGYGWFGGMEDGGIGVPTNQDSAAGTDSREPSSHTTTNNQEVGVDEADLMKTDGNFIYVLAGSTVHIVESWPAEEAHEVSSVDLAGSGSSLFLLEDRLVAFSQVWDYYEGGGERIPEPMDDEGSTGSDSTVVESGFNGLRITVIDISDRTAPVVEATHDIEGNLVSARMIDGRIYLALSSGYYGGLPYEIYEEIYALELPPIDYYMATPEELEAAREEAREIVRPVIARLVDEYRDLLLPDMRSNEGDREEAFSCSDIFRTGQDATIGLLAVLGFDPTTGEGPQGSAVLADGYNVYASDSAMFIAQDSRWWSFGPTDSPYAESFIHKFELRGLSPRYLASGVVPGYMLNQFSMSELGGYLRVATTDQNWWGGGVWLADDVAAEEEPEIVAEPANNVFVLDEIEGELIIVGEIRGIAPTEQIFAVRFMGKRGYVVTFRQVDPLYALDLSDPTNPQIMGELHIPGFSRYLHPIGDTHLIGVGQDADEDGRVTGFQVQLFDVSDLANPVRTHQEVISGWSSSEVEWDHHAFTFDEERGLLAVPVTLEDWMSDTYSYFTGLIVYDVDTETGFAERGRITHDEIAGGGVDCYDEWDCYGWAPPIRRSAFIDDFLFAISDFGVTASSLDNIDEFVSTVIF